MTTRHICALAWSAAAVALIAAVALAWLMPRSSAEASRHEARVTGNRCALIIGPAHAWCPAESGRTSPRPSPAVDNPRLDIPVRIAVLPWVAAMVVSGAGLVWVAGRSPR
jgi:hypothetical protein